MKFRRTTALLVLPIFVLGAAHLARTDTTDDVVALSSYRAALDQISQGRAGNARMILETSNALQRPEIAALLAYLQEKDGESNRARLTLQGVSQPTGLINAYEGRFSIGAPAVFQTVAATPKNGASLPASDSRLIKLEETMFKIVNAERAKNGLSQLQIDPKLADVARAHSAEMRDKQYFAHESPTPNLKDPLDRFQAAFGSTPRIIAENVYRAWGSRSFLNEKEVETAHQALMDSPGHRANILAGGVTRLGIGFATNATGDIWITQMFAK